MIAASIFISSLRSYQDETRSATETRNERLTQRIQSDIKIENAVYYSAGDNLRIKAKNKGSTVLETSSIQVFLNGEMIKNENISNRLVNGTTTNIWSPEENFELSILNQENKPQRIKMTAEHGISDYFINIENR